MVDSTETSTLTQFLGRYGSLSTPLVPNRNFSIGSRSASVRVSFDLLALDGLEGSGQFEDFANFIFSSGTSTETIRLSFGSNVDEGSQQGTSDVGTISWSFTSGQQQNFGFQSDNDQVHSFVVIIPGNFISANVLNVEFLFETTGGGFSESFGIDNIRVSECVV